MTGTASRWEAAREGWDRFWFAPRSTAPVELFRIAVGVLVTAWFLSFAPVLEDFFGLGAALPLTPTLPLGQWTLFSLIGGTWLIWPFWAVAVLAGVAVTVGWRTRLAALLVVIGTVSLTRQAAFALNTGDALVRILSIYLLLMPAGSAASVDHPTLHFPRRPPWALRLAQVQLSVIYLDAVWEKSAGVLWRDGTAVSFALRAGEVGRLPLPLAVSDSSVLSQLLTFGTLAVELSVGVLVWNRTARPWVLGLGALLHLGIEIVLVVGFFSLAMWTLYLVFVPADRAERLLRAAWARRPGRRDPSVDRPDAPEPTVDRPAGEPRPDHPGVETVGAGRDPQTGHEHPR